MSQLRLKIFMNKISNKIEDNGVYPNDFNTTKNYFEDVSIEVKNLQKVYLK